MSDGIYIILPVFNEAEIIAEVLRDLKEHGYNNLIVIDDGSSDQTYQNAIQENVVVLRHKINRGKGAAVKTGITAATKLGAEIVVTMDGDGQHSPADIERLIAPIREDHVDVVLGSRMIASDGMPKIKVIANKIGNLVTFFLYGLHVTDSQSGFRAYSYFATTKIDTKADKYEYDSKVLREIRHNRLRYVEIPVEVRYTEYSMGKPHKQGFINGLKTLVRMIWGMIV